MARTHAQSSSARLWAGLLFVLALAACVTGIARPASAVSSVDMAPMVAAPMTMSSPEAPAAGPAAALDDLQALEVAEEPCPMSGMDCTSPVHQYRPSTLVLPSASGAASTAAADRAAVLIGLEAVAPSPASREGPDLDRLCLSRT